MYDDGIDSSDVLYNTSCKGIEWTAEEEKMESETVLPELLSK